MIVIGCEACPKCHDYHTITTSNHSHMIALIVQFFQCHLQHDRRFISGNVNFEALMKQPLSGLLLQERALLWSELNVYFITSIIAGLLQNLERQPSDYDKLKEFSASAAGFEQTFSFSPFLSITVLKRRLLRKIGAPVQMLAQLSNVSGKKSSRRDCNH